MFPLDEKQNKNKKKHPNVTQVGRQQTQNLEELDCNCVCVILVRIMWSQHTSTILLDLTKSMKWTKCN